jgi:hypothetical protein
VSDPSPEELLERLREAAGSPPRPPLRVPLPVTSQRRGPIGPLVTGARRALLRLIAPALLELVNQLEADRGILHGRVAELEERLATLERTDRRGTSEVE